MSQFSAGQLTTGERLPILLTSAINATAPFTKISNVSQRVAATLRALVNWRALCPDTDFVLCDGSGYDLSREVSAADRSAGSSRTEILCFENDRDQVRDKGKGHGEGEIIKYALENSSTLKSAPSFAKCTGKLWVENYWSCRTAYNGIAGFSYFGFLKVVAVDTRFFIVQRQFFQDKLLGSYTQCDDPLGKYLENVYLDALQSTRRKNWMLPVYPIIRGLSGTSGQEYRHDFFKQAGKNLAIRLLRRKAHSGP